MSKVYKFWMVLLGVIGGFSLVYGIVVLISMGYQPSYLYFWIGLFLLCLFLEIGIWVTTRNGKIPPRWIVIPVEILVLMFCLVFIIIEAVIIQWSKEKPTNDADYLIILGAKVNGDQPSLTLRQRIQTAAEYLKQNPGTVAIASGGKGSDEDISEAQCIYEQLVALGIEPERILMEDQSTSTKENLEFSSKIIKENEDYALQIYWEYYMNPDDDGETERSEYREADGDETITDREQRIRELVEREPIHETVVLTTTDFHIYRAMYLADQEGYGVVYGNPAPSAWWLIPTNYTREFLAVLKDVVLGRVVG